MTAREALDRATLEHMTTAVLVFDADSALLYMNPAAEELLGASLNQVQGSTSQLLFSETPMLARALKRVVDSGQPLTERETRLEVAGVGVVTADCVMTPMSVAGSAPLGLLELIPLDRQKQITREERLVAESASARAVLRGLAHEIRNPLGGLRGAAQLLERELGAQELREYTRVIVREADRLQGLMDRMLGPRVPPKLRRVSVHEVTERVFALISAEAPAGVRVDKDYDPSIPDLEADPELLIQAVLNVARNATQAVRDGGRVWVRTRIHRQFTIGQRRHGMVARVEIVDNGPGVPEEIKDRVFFPLVTGRSEGSGLGLSIAQSLVNQHGGLIEYDSRPGHTVFSILLPVRNGNGDH